MILEMHDICKDYPMGRSVSHILKNVELCVSEGDYLAIMGPSGSGKTTLMNLIGCLDVPTSGTYLLDGKDIGKCSSNELADIRNKEIGFVFQSFHLLPKLTALDNVALPLLYGGVEKNARREMAIAALETVGLGDKTGSYPDQLSGGQCQRVAIARAIVGKPRLLLADEPTGALDSKATDELLRLFAEVNKRGQTILMVTHSVKAASTAKRVLFIKDGEVFHQLYRGDSTDSELYQKISDTLTMLATGGDKR